MTQKVDVAIIGGGLTGLTLAFYLKKEGKKVVILEQSSRLGGVIQTGQENGFTYEKGPSTGTLSSIELVKLFADLGDSCALETANKESKNRWILYKGKWIALPSNPLDAVKIPLFTWHDKFRILGEPFRKKGNNPDETLSELVKRRLGKSYLDYAVDPFVSGIYAGDPNRLVTRFAMPKLYKLEQNYGSFIKGAIKKRKEPKSPQEKMVTKEVFSVKGGLQNLVHALEMHIGKENYILNCHDIKVNKFNDAYHIHYNADADIVADNVVATVGAYTLPHIFPFITENEWSTITNLNYAKVVQVTVGFKNWQGMALNAFGGLVPTVENRDILGVLFPSSIFEDRAPKNGALLSVFMGGMKRDDIIKMTDNEIKNIVENEIVSIFKLKDFSPDLLKIFRYEKAIAQYENTSEKRLDTIQQIENQYKGLYLAGSVRDGIGMADRVKQAVHIFNQLNNKD